MARERTTAVSSPAGRPTSAGRPGSDREHAERLRPRRAPLVGVTLAALVALATACGRKTDPRPPELVAPRSVGELTLTTQADGIALRWSRPTQYVDGSAMEDLGGFAVQRSRYNSPFVEIARVPVTDRGRFQKAKRFDYVDRDLLPGATYHYRIVAFTTDGYHSAPSGAATVTWTPLAAPSPAPSPERGPEQPQAHPAGRRR